MSAVFVFNPTIHDTTIQYGGRYFLFPKGATTKVEDWVSQSPNEYLRNVSAEGKGAQDDPNAFYQITVAARRMVDEMLKRHQCDYYERGFVVSDEPISQLDQKVAKDKAEIWGRKLCDQFFQERRERQLTGYGRLYPDEIELDWIKHLGLDDQILNPMKAERSALDKETIHELSVGIGREIAQVLAGPKGKAQI